MLKKVVTDCDTDINKKPVSITVFRGSCFNYFYRHFRKPWIAKKDCCCRCEVKFAVEDAIDESDVSRESYTGRQGLKKIFLKIFSLLLFPLSEAVAWSCSMKYFSVLKYLVKFTGKHLSRSFFLAMFY